MDNELMYCILFQQISKNHPFMVYDKDNLISIFRAIMDIIDNME